MKFLDLFAGIGGFRLGLEQAGHTCVGFVEIDKFARKSYEAIFDTKGEYTEHDINCINTKELPEADIWCFGFPCQDISVAGKQKGFEGNRSSLFFAVTRKLHELEDKKKPSYLLIENVKNLLSINSGWDFASLQIELDSLGYDIEWDILNSKEVVPQNRERVFIIGHFRGRCTRKVFPIERKGEPTSDERQKINIVGTTKPTDSTRLGQRDVVYDLNGLMGMLGVTDYKQPKQIAVIQVGNISNSDSFGGNPQVGRVYSTDGLSPALNTMQGGGREPKILQRSRENNKDGAHDISPTVSTSSFENNNLLTVPVLTPDRLVKRQNGRRFKENEDPMFTLNTQDRHGIYDGMSIRKLTPRECWRLQGFPDWAFDRAEKVNSNSQLYKQAGNSVTVPVIYEIAKRMNWFKN